MSLQAPHEFPMRINVSYLLSPEVLEFVLRSNSEIFRQGGEFQFAPIGRQIPHITMLMGTVDNNASLRAVSDIVALTAAGFDAISYSIGEPYFPAPDRRYVFVDTDPQAAFLAQRTVLQERLGHLLEIDDFGDANNVSHITLGFNDSGNDLAVLGEPSGGTTRGIASSLQIALTGPRGTCIETLELFAVGNPHSTTD